MVTRYTSRLGLTVHDMGDEVDAQRREWERLDEAFAGVTWVTPGTIPDESTLYDGMLVAENGTGKIWRAIKTESGAYTQFFIKYPWAYYGEVGTFQAAHNSWLYWGTAPVEARCFNSGTADLDYQSGLIIPLKGIYEFNCHMRLGTETDNYGAISHRINGVIDENSHGVYSNSLGPPVGGVLLVSKAVRKLEKGDIVFPAYWQYSGNGASKGLSLVFSAVMVRPLP